MPGSVRLLAFLCLALASQIACANDVVGTWRLLSIETVRENGEIIYEWMGQKPTGLIVYESNGLMSVQIMRDPRPTFADGSRLKATSEELKSAYLGYYAYWGRYKVDAAEGAIVHEVESSLWPEEIGKSNKRSYVLDGTRLVLTTTPYQRGYEKRSNRLTWERTD